MHNCQFDSLRGYSYKLSNTIINCPYFMNGGIFMPLASSLQFFDGTKSYGIFECKREISAIDMQGYFIAIGEKASPGQLISAVLLDIRAIDKAKIFNYQKTQINFIAVSPDGQFICSVGSSSEDTQQLNVIEVNNQSQVGTRVMFTKQFKKKDGRVKAIKFSNNDPNFFVLLTVSKVILMKIDASTQSVEEVQMKTSKVRQYNNIIFAPNDQFLYGCSKNGDIAEISIQENKQSRIGPRKRVITKGISNIKYLHPGYLVIIGKEGLLALIQIETMALLKQIKLQGEQIYSLTEFDKTLCYLSTNKANVYKFDAKNFEVQLCYSAHTSQINDLAVMPDFQSLFATCAASDIVIWRTKEMKPIIKISLMKVVCLSLCLPKNGKYIISGWDDDCIRIFYPNNGKLQHKISGANLGAVTKIVSDTQSTKIICGGENGMIRIWNILQNKIFGLIIGSLAFHLKKINSLKINPFNNDQLISCGEDGYCAVWSLKNFELRSKFYVTSFVKQATFISEFKIEVVGAGSYIFECLINNGQLINKKEVNGTSINCVLQNVFDQTDQMIIVYGGDDPHLNYIEISYGGNHANKLLSYGVITKMAITCDKASLIAVTQNGIILKYGIFAIKKKNEDQY